MTKFKTIAAAATLALSASYAAEAAITITVTDGNLTYSLWEGNDNPSSNADWAAFLAETGYEQIGKYNTPDDENPAGFYEGEEFDITGELGKSGTWSSSFGVNAVAIKGGNNFLLIEYGDDAPVFGDNWCTDSSCMSLFGSVYLPTVPNGSGRGSAGLSHLSLYALEKIENGIPEPATWLMMIMGFGFVGMASRRRIAARAA